MLHEVPMDLAVLAWGLLVSCIVVAGILTGEWRQLLMSLPDVSWHDWTFSRGVLRCLTDGSNSGVRSVQGPEVRR